MAAGKVYARLVPSQVKRWMNARETADGMKDDGRMICGIVRAAFAAEPPAQVAQLVEQRTENPCVGGSIPPLATNSLKDLALS